MLLSIRLCVITALFCSTILPALSQKPELVVPTGHSAALNSVVFSPDGKMLASGSWDNTVKLWDVATGRELHTFAGHSAAVTAVVFSPDGKMLASGSLDKTVKLWDVAAPRERFTFASHTGAVFCIAFGADGQTLASGSSDKTAKLWDVQTGQVLRTFERHLSGINSIAFSADGKLLASGGTDKTVRLWNLATGQELNILTGHTERVNSVSFSTDRRTLASGSNDNSIKLWDITTGREVRTLSGHSAFITFIAFTPDGRNLVSSGGFDRTIRFWQVKSGRQIRVVETLATVLSAAMSHDGKKLAGGCLDSRIILWNTETSNQLSEFAGHARNINAAALSPNVQVVASGLSDGTIKLWDRQRGGELRTLSGRRVREGSHVRSVDSVTFSPNGNILASGSSDKTIRLWDLTTGKELQTILGHQDWVNSVAFSPDGSTLVSGSGSFLEKRTDDSVRLWDVSTGQEILKIIGHKDAVNSVAFSADGRMLASGSSDKTIKLWDARTGRETCTLLGHSNKISSVAFAPNNRLLASGSRDGAIKLWDIKQCHEQRTLKGHSSNVRSVAFAPDGKTFVSGSFDETIKLWDAATGLEMQTLAGHSAGVNAVAFSSDAKLLLSGGDDAKTKLWNVASGKELITLIALDEKDWIVVTPDARFDGSAHSMKLIYYVQNNQPIPIDSFFEQFYTPKLLAQVLSGETAQARPTSVDFSKKIRLPPLVRITGPVAGESFTSDEIQINVEATDQGGGVEDIRLYQNGKVIQEDTRQLARESAVKTKIFTLTLLPGINTFRATAFNKDRTEATPYEVSVELRAAEASSNLYVLAIGLNEYKNTRYNLNYARADAQAFADAVEQRGRSIFKHISKRIMFDSDATRVNIEAAFNEIIKQARPQDAFVFYYAGHGVMSVSDDKSPADFYLVPHEVVQIYGDGGSLTANGIAARILKELLKNIRAQKQLIILDACESGGALQTIAMRGASEEKAIIQLARSTGVAVLASAGQDQVATEFDKLGHGVFTYALLKGLSGEADGAPRDGKITIKELEAYISDQVPVLTKLHRGKRQDPNSWTRGQDFPIAIR